MLCASRRFRRDPRRQFDAGARGERRQKLGELSRSGEEDGVDPRWRSREDARQRRAEAGDGALTTEERRAARELSAVLGAAILVATAGGELAGGERAELSRSLMQVGGGALDEAAVEGALAQWMDALRRDGQEACFAAVAEVLGGNDARYEAFQVAAGVALVDGDLTELQSEALHRLAQASGLSSQEADQLFEGVETWMD